MSNNKVEDLTIKFLHDQNIVNLFGEVTDGLAMNIITEMQYMDYRFQANNVPEGERVITMQINSPGGSVDAGLAIHDVMKTLSCKVRTVGIGLAASMGAFLLASGTKGYRFALPHCRVLIHQPLGGAMGQAIEVIAYADNIRRTRDELNRLLSEYTGQPIQKIEKNTDRDYIMNGYEAKEYGMVDEVYTAPQKQ